MNKDLITRFATTSLILAVLFFAIEVLSGEIAFQFQNILPYLISALIGTGVGIIYFQFVGFRFTKFQFISCVVPTILFSVLITKSGLNHYWVLNELTLMVAFLMVIINSIENKRKSL
tara:strand:+ start:276 stop:626 length:351 start_codon:yes stop_codon:yes gene_type:complete